MENMSCRYSEGPNILRAHAGYPSEYSPLPGSTHHLRLPGTVLMTTHTLHLQTEGKFSERPAENGRNKKRRGKKGYSKCFTPLLLDSISLLGGDLLKTLVSTLKIQILLGLPTEFPNQPPHTEPKHRSLPASSTQTHKELFPHNINDPVSKNANFPPLFCAGPAGGPVGAEGVPLLILECSGDKCGTLLEEDLLEVLKSS